MDKPFTLDPTAEETPEEIAAIKAELSTIFAQMERLNQLMAKDQQEIERLKARSHETRAQTRKLLEKMPKA